jgi:GxxExxY protein
MGQPLALEIGPIDLWVHQTCLLEEAKARTRGKMTEQTAIIREIAEDVYRTLGSGFSEEVYDRAMQVGLRLANIGYEGQKVIELKYRDHYVGEGYPDLVVHLGKDRLVVELKAISGELGASEEQQLRNYMTILNVPRGLLINFQQPGRRQGKTKLDIRELVL